MNSVPNARAGRIAKLLRDGEGNEIRIDDPGSEMPILAPPLREFVGLGGCLKIWPMIRPGLDY